MASKRTILSKLDMRDRIRLYIVCARCSLCQAERGEPCRGWKRGEAWLTATHGPRQAAVREFRKRHRETYLKLAAQLVAQHLGGAEEEETRG